MAQLGFNVAEVEPSSGEWEPIPDGTEVELHFTEEEMKRNSKDTGDLLTLKAEVIGGEYEGRSITVRVNASHNSPVTQKIGQEEIAAICASIGIVAQDTEELLWKPFRAIVGVEEYAKKDGSTGYSNKIKKYLFEQDNAPPAEKPAPAKPAPRPAAASRPAPGAKPGAPSLPWKRSG